MLIPPPLRAFREQQTPPLTQDQLGDLLGVTKATVSRWETGSRKIDDDLLPTVSERTGIPKHVLRPDLAKLMQQAAE